MRVMVIAKATEDGEKGVLPGRDSVKWSRGIRGISLKRRALYGFIHLCQKLGGSGCVIAQRL